MAGLFWYSDRVPGKAALDALRLALTLRTGQDKDSNVLVARNRVFARLVRMADPAVLDGLAEANQLGMSSASPFGLPSSRYSGGETWGASAGIGWLVETAHDDRGQLVSWHGYDDATYAGIVAKLLEPTGSEYFWNLLGQALRADWSSHMRRNGRKIPGGFDRPAPAVIHVACEAWTRRCARDESVPRQEVLRSLLMLLEIGRRRATEDAAALAEIAALHAACHRAASFPVRLLALAALPDALDETQRQALIAALGDRNASVATEARRLARKAGIPISRDLLAGALQSSSPQTRVQVLNELAPLVEGDATAPGHAAAARSRRHGARRGVQLPRHPDEARVGRRSSRSAQGLREGGARRRGGRADCHPLLPRRAGPLGPASSPAPRASPATAPPRPLLKQAAPDRDTPSRILAIRSLGQLGVAETLPFLIDWSNSENAAVATAARAAIAKIHAQGR